MKEIGTNYTKPQIPDVIIDEIKSAQAIVLFYVHPAGTGRTLVYSREAFSAEQLKAINDRITMALEGFQSTDVEMHLSTFY